MNKMNIVGRILSYLVPFKKRILFAVIILIIAISIGFLQPLVIQRITDIGMVQKNMNAIFQAVNSTPFVRQYDIMFNRWGDFNAKGSTKQTIYAGVQENGCRNHEKRTSEYPCNDAGIQHY